ncbi:MAG: preprotein translocase subunit SecG [Spirochaetia bacterium]|nr:preprotein translocase subunit SecG [Spirochaetia bacterium]
MGVIGIILLVLFVLASLLLVLLVAIQSDSGSGLGGVFGGGSDSTFGAQSSKVLTKITAILGGSFLVIALLLAVINKTPSTDTLTDLVTTDQVQESTEWWNQSSSN